MRRYVTVCLWSRRWVKRRQQLCEFVRVRWPHQLDVEPAEAPTRHLGHSRAIAESLAVPVTYETVSEQKLDRDEANAPTNGPLNAHF